MAGYRQSNPDKAKAAAAALLVHVAIGAAFLTGLVTKVSRHPADVLTTFDVTEPPPPPIVDIEPAEKSAEPDPGEAGKKAKPTPVVVPEPKIVVPAKPPLAAAPVAGQGAAPTAGAAPSGAGTGAGGSGNGLGGGGWGGGGGGAGFTPARIIRKIPDSQYRRISGGRIPAGSATLFFVVNADGHGSNCRIQRSSGDAGVDAVLCDVAMRYMRFSPARDPRGKPVAQEMGYTPTWRPNR